MKMMWKKVFKYIFNHVNVNVCIIISHIIISMLISYAYHNAIIIHRFKIVPNKIIII